MTVRRREFLTAGCALACMSACGGRLPGAAVPTDTGGNDDEAPADATCDDTLVPDATWIEIPLAAYPTLRERGGWDYVVLPDDLVNVIVVHGQDGCYRAIWRICTHGACENDWDPAASVARCPCHGSEFADDGSVLRGPATRGVRAFPVVRVGESLWLKR